MSIHDPVPTCATCHEPIKSHHSDCFWVKGFKGAAAFPQGEVIAEDMRTPEQIAMDQRIAAIAQMTSEEARIELLRKHVKMLTEQKAALQRQLDMATEACAALREHRELLKRQLAATSDSERADLVGCLIESDAMVRLRQIQAVLHGGTDRERDLGHKLWLILNSAQPIFDGELK
jgi:hypothetical protein